MGYLRKVGAPCLSECYNHRPFDNQHHIEAFYFMKNFKLNPEECALLVVDVQVDFCSPEGATARRGRPNTKMQALPSKD